MLGCEPLDAFARRVGIALTHRNHMHGRMCHQLVGWTAVLKPDPKRVRFESASSRWRTSATSSQTADCSATVSS